MHASRVYSLAYRLSGDAEKARSSRRTLSSVVLEAPAVPGRRRVLDLAAPDRGHLVSNARRSEIRFAREVALEEAHSIEVSAPEADPDLKECIARAVENLSEAYRTTLIMHDIEGYTHAEIAGILGVPEGTSKSRLSAARAQLRVELAAFKE